MPNLFTVMPGESVADVSAAHILSQVSGDARANAVVFVPTRRAAVSMRRAFQKILGGEASLLPRILPLAESAEALLTLLGPRALPVLEAIPPAMSKWQQRYLLARQVSVFLQRRTQEDIPVTLDYTLALADELMKLEDQCARAAVQLTSENLRTIGGGAEHWQQALDFLKILAEFWPAIEAEIGMITQSRRETLLLKALADAWRAAPPKYTVYAVGSTASQESTAELLQVIAELPNGAVILPGINPAVDLAEWESITSGHPLYHLKHFLDRFPMQPSSIALLGECTNSIWLSALVSADVFPQWGSIALADYASIRIVPCAHAEAEARVISLLMREALETPGKRTALITPDEGLMGRVAAQMKRYGVTIDRLDRGTLLQSDYGSLWALLLAALLEPERLLPIRALLHHRLISVDEALLTALESCWYGTVSRRVGQMPPLPESVRLHADYPLVETLVRNLARLARPNVMLAAGDWVDECRRLLEPLLGAGNEQEAIDEMLDLLKDADILGGIAAPEFAYLMQEHLAEPRRHAGVATHPHLTMVTPVEARLEQFDRVILGSMTEDIWPGITPPNAWLNLAAQAALGLPPPTHHVSLMAHDLLMLGSGKEVFLTWPRRSQGSPTTRSRFIERLVTMLAMHGIPEAQITAVQYVDWAEKLFASAEFMPGLPPKPMPPSEERPRRLPVSALDDLASDPFSIYAKYILGLRKLNEIDADAQASDFGSLAHKAIQALTMHWNEHQQPASPEQVSAMADHALQAFSERSSTALFWRSRLIRALHFVNEVEEERRQPGAAVQAELPIEAPLTLADDSQLVLVGKIDRLEETAGGAVIADYKTGEIPPPAEVTQGYKTQLLAYAMLAEEVAAVEYWRLPHAAKRGEIKRYVFDDLKKADLPEKLKALLMQMLDAQTPFLASPGRIEDYNGISRYEEWAE